MHYAFYLFFRKYLLNLTVSLLGRVCMHVSLWDKFLIHVKRPIFRSALVTSVTSCSKEMESRLCLCVFFSLFGFISISPAVEANLQTQYQRLFRVTLQTEINTVWMC